VAGCGTSFFVGSQPVDFSREQGHQCAASRRRTSAHGTVFATPRSISATQRLTLVVHAASASSSPSAWQGLSGKVLAKRARDDYVLSHLRLAAESRERIGILPRARGQNLDRHVAIEPRVAPPVDSRSVSSTWTRSIGVPTGATSSTGR
jgi:hypothetical protein